MKVSTSEENGILLYNQDEPIAMEIHQGHVRVTYNPGNQPATAIHRSTQTNTHTHTHTHTRTRTRKRTRAHVCTRTSTHTRTHTLCTNSFTSWVWVMWGFMQQCNTCNQRILFSVFWLHQNHVEGGVIAVSPGGFKVSEQETDQGQPSAWDRELATAGDGSRLLPSNSSHHTKDLRGTAKK